MVHRLSSISSMHFTTLITTVALSTLASAWHLQLYADQLYQNIIHDRSGTLGQPCANLDANANDKASSMHWDGGAEIVLFAEQGCVAEVGRSRGSWHVPNFSSFANDKVSSYKINF